MFEVGVEVGVAEGVARRLEFIQDNTLRHVGACGSQFTCESVICGVVISRKGRTTF